VRSSRETGGLSRRPHAAGISQFHTVGYPVPVAVGKAQSARPLVTSGVEGPAEGVQATSASARRVPDTGANARLAAGDAWRTGHGVSVWEESAKARERLNAAAAEAEKKEY